MVREIALSGTRGHGLVALVDDDDYDLVANFGSWCAKAGRNGTMYCSAYVRGSYTPGSVARGRRIHMHTFITGYDRVDHLDHNGLNNCWYNMRSATHTQNLRNMRSVTGASQYKGVIPGTPGKLAGPWVAQIKIDAIRIRRTGIETEVDAALKYDELARAYFGDRAFLNFP